MSYLSQPMCVSIEEHFLKSLHGGHTQWSKQNQKKPYSHVKEERKKEKETPSFCKTLNKWVRLSWTRQYFTPGLFVKSLSQIFSLQALQQSQKVYIIDSIPITKLVFKIVILVKNYYRRVHYKRFIGFHWPP